jgi:hypothetical protein
MRIMNRIYTEIYFLCPVVFWFLEGNFMGIDGLDEYLPIYHCNQLIYSNFFLIDKPSTSLTWA